MIPLWIFIVACVVFIGILVWEVIRYRQLDILFDEVAMMLGYYTLRFGEVTPEEYRTLYGVDKEKLK